METDLIDQIHAHITEFEVNKADILNDTPVVTTKYVHKKTGKEYLDLRQMMDDKVNLGDIEEKKKTVYLRDSLISKITGTNRMTEEETLLITDFLEMCMLLNSDVNYKKQYNKLANTLAKIKREGGGEEKIIELEEQKVKLNRRYKKIVRTRKVSDKVKDAIKGDGEWENYPQMVLTRNQFFKNSLELFI